jgi:hypothetical protein
MMGEDKGEGESMPIHLSGLPSMNTIIPERKGIFREDDFLQASRL